MKNNLKFSKSARLVLENAKGLANRLSNDYIDARHIVVAMYSSHSGLAYRVMLKMESSPMISIRWRRPF